MIKKIIYILVLIFISNTCFAQNMKDVETLLKKLEQASNDTIKAGIYKDLCWIYRSDNLKLAADYGVKALQLYTLHNHILGQCDVLNKLGIVKRNTGEYSLALDYFFKILSIAEQPLCNNEIAYANNNICDVFIRLERFDKALEFADKALPLFSISNDKSGIAYNLNLKGLIYKNQKKWNNALPFFKQSLDIRLQIKHQVGIATSWQYIADCYLELNLIDSAYLYYKKSLDLFIKNGEKPGLSYIGMGKYFAAKKNYKKAIFYLNEAISISKIIKNPNILQKASEVLHKVYFSINDYENAYRFQTLANTTKDSLQNTDYIRKITSLEMNYHFEQQKKLENIELVNKKEAYESKIKIQKWITYSISAIFLIFIGLVIVGYRNFKYVRKTNLTLLESISDLTKAEEQINKLSIAVEQSPITIVITDINGCIEYVNPKFSELTGYSFEETVGKNPRILKSDKTDPKVYQDLWQTISRGETWVGEFINKKKNGEEFIENALIAPIFDKDKKIINYIGLEEDITARKRTEETLFNERALFRTIIDLIPEAIYVKDRQGRKILANPKEVMLSGKLSEEELLGKTDFDIYPEHVAIQSANEDALILQSGKPILNIESELTDENGHTKWQLGSKVPLLDIHGQITGIVGVSHDNTQRKQAEQTMLQYNEELKSLNDSIELQKSIIERSNAKLHGQASELSAKNRELEQFNLQLEKYYTVLNQSPTAVVITDIHGNIEYINPFFTTITGYTLSEVIGKNPRILKTNKTPKETFTDLWQTILSGKVWEGILINHKKDKSLFTERAIISPIFVNEQITGFVAIKEDVTELKKAEQMILESLDTTQNQKIIIEKAYKDITDSINYAKTIQDALLTSNELINSYIDEYFLVFKPKQVVSGDFYYVNKIDDNLIFGVSDCTGHGVPGGFITILGITYLHETIRQADITTPGAALNMLRQRIKTTFKSFGTINTNGMDISLCSVNSKTNILQYSGANNPIFIIRNGELIEFKATKNPIGFYLVEVDFENVEFQLCDNDLIYLFSDGFQDQFGGENFRKFTKKRLKELLLEIHQKPLTVQQEIVETTLANWQGNLEQIDDITLLVLKWKIS